MEIKGKVHCFFEQSGTFKNPSIRIGRGKPEWGAEPGKQYFVITWEAQDEVRRAGTSRISN